MTYKEKVILVLKNLGGHAYLNDIYQEFKKISKGETLAETYQASIRATLERNSKDSEAYDHKHNLFYSVDGIGNGHWGLIDFEDRQELTQDDDNYCEGKLALKQHLQRERNPKLIRDAKKLFIEKNGRLFCEVCGFDFEKIYGELGKNFIEAHHTKPVSQMTGGEKTRIKDIVMVCSNCHSMIHRKKPFLNKSELTKIINQK